MESVREDAHWRNVLGANTVDHTDPGERVLDLPFADIQEFELHIHDSPDPFSCSCDGRPIPRREEDPAQPQALRPTHVRFHSRVRITSGFRRHRRQSSLHHAIDQNLFTGSSPGSSLSSESGSASSSISAPLRTRTGGEPGKSGWGVLGQRIRFLPQNNSQKQKSGKGRRETKHIITNERTPLTWSPAHPSYLNAPPIEYGSLAHESSEEPRISRRIWPRRLTSNRWWWWRLHLIICCRSTEESDSFVE
ncbi:hypothetical protein K443DRAFT_4758 [Laccaria amethystina LaAM-08-1]|uniref:Uncharacterized protein n=1 Tax=Laccaria amethystina LaAM-08-1 TaxID=1095629 RepID=A0A0C9XH49_9AGAR|nr:hypothetical protein K443DRAFT_4758 [Laccaria amethystina LaAM-08-1]